MNKLSFEEEIYSKLKEAEEEAEQTDLRFTSEEVLEDMKAVIFAHDSSI